MKKSVILFLIVLCMFSCTTEDNNIEETTHQLIYWRDSQGPPIDFYVDDVLKGAITFVSEETPKCGDDRGITITLVPNVDYEIFAVERETLRVWRFTDTGQENTIECLAIAFQ